MNNIKTILLIGRTGNGKSTLVNVLTESAKFIEGEFAVSETKKIQYSEFRKNGVRYRVIDTIGIGDTNMTLNKVLRKLALMAHSVKDGLSQIFFVTDGKLAKEAESTYNLLKKVVFDENIASYTTVIRTNFAGFRNEEVCKEEKREMIENSGEFKWLVEECNEIIFVDNPPTTGSEEEINLNKKRREESRKILLEHLESICQDGLYKPANLDALSDAIGEHITKKIELKEEGKKGGIDKFRRKRKNSSLNSKLTERMTEHVGSIDSGLKEKIKEELKKLENQKNNKKMILNPLNWRLFKGEESQAKIEVLNSK